MPHMSEVGIRALKQNASAVVAQAAAGDTQTITDRGRPVAQITPLPASPLQGLLDSGQARPPKLDINNLPNPSPGPDLAPELAGMRNAERY